MFSHLQITDPRERRLVGLADAMLAVPAAVARWLPRKAADAAPARILLLRLERIGDLLMSLDAIAAVREEAPGAEIDLVVGSWNAAIANLIPHVSRVETLDAPWLARNGGGDGGSRLVARALIWRRRRYDLAINFEGDLRSHALLALSGARRRVGFPMAGGRALLTDAVDFDPGAHTSANGLRLVRRAFDVPERAPEPRDSPRSKLTLPESARRHAEEALRIANGGREEGPRPLHVAIGIHPGGGRAVKQWEPDRFAEVATRLGRRHGATIVLTGAAEERPLVDRVRAAIPADVRVLDLAGRLDLIPLAAVLERLALFVTADTGPMHLAAAVGTPIVALFGPSDPRRYAPLARTARILRVDLPCSPCNRIRRPPERCTGHVPDCLTGVETARVVEAAEDLLAGAAHAIARQNT